MRLNHKTIASVLVIVGTAILILTAEYTTYPTPGRNVLSVIAAILLLFGSLDYNTAIHAIFLRLLRRKPNKGPTPWDINTPEHRQLRNTLITNMRLTWIDPAPLAERIHNRLDLTYDPADLTSPRHYLEGYSEEAQPYPTTKSLLDLFDKSGRHLLLLGDPGSGKTHNLTSLARSLLNEATPQNTAPIPLILNLSSWAADPQPLPDWLSSEILIQYGINPAITPTLLQTEQLCLLLDGLDEMPVGDQTALLVELGRFHSQYPLPLVICSRPQDYNCLSTSLNIHTALILQPLTDQQIMTYLTDQRRHLSAIHQAIIAGDVLYHLAQKPLYLLMMTIAYRGISPTDLQLQTQNIDQRRDHLIQTYIKQSLEDQSTQLTQSLGRLTYLARQLTNHHQTHFFLETLQPDWLPSIDLGRFRRIAAIITGLTITLVLALTSFIILNLNGAPQAEEIALLLGGTLITALIIIPIVWKIFDPPSKTHLVTLAKSTILARGGLLSALLFTLVLFPIFYDHPSLIFLPLVVITFIATTRRNSQYLGPPENHFLLRAAKTKVGTGLIFSVMFMLAFDLSVGFLAGMVAALISMRADETAETGVKWPSRAGIPKMLHSGVFFGFVYGLIYLTRFDPSTALISAVIAALTAALLAGTDLGAVSPPRWRRPSRAELKSIAAGTLGLGLIIALALTIWMAAEFGFDELLLIIAGFIFLFIGGFNLMEKMMLPAHYVLRNKPGEGIGRTATNALAGGIIIIIQSTLTGTVVGTLTAALSFGAAAMYTWLELGLIGGALIGLAFGIIAGLTAGLTHYGAAAFIQHYLTRWNLARNHLLPFNLHPFLNQMHTYHLLHHTGPHYHFIHPTLQSFLASQLVPLH